VQSGHATVHEDRLRGHTGGVTDQIEDGIGGILWGRNSAHGASRDGLLKPAFFSRKHARKGIGVAGERFDARDIDLVQDPLGNLGAGTILREITEEIEKRFMAMVSKLRSAYDLCCSSEDISKTERDYIHFYFAARSIIYKLTKGDTPDAAQMNDKVKQMIQEALISDGVEEIFKLDKNDPKNNVDIFSDEYLKKIDKIKLPNTKIKLLQKLLAKAINEFKKTNRIKGVDFSKRLKKLIATYNERKDFDVFQSHVLDDVAEQFSDLFKDLQKELKSFEDLGINFEEKAFYDILKAVAEKYQFEYPEDKLIILSQAVKAIVDDKARYTDWSQKADIKAELKVDLILTLDKHGYPPVPKDEVFKEIFEQAENFKKYSEE